MNPIASVTSIYLIFSKSFLCVLQGFFTILSCAIKCMREVEKGRLYELDNFKA